MLPVAQQALLGVGVPLAAGAAIVGQVRERRGSSSTTRPGETPPAPVEVPVLPLPGGSSADVLGAVDALGSRLADALERAAERQAEILERIGDPRSLVPALPEQPGPPLTVPGPPAGRPGRPGDGGPITTLPIGPPRPVPSPPAARPPTVADPPARSGPPAGPGAIRPLPVTPVSRPSPVVIRRPPDPMTPIREAPARPAPPPPTARVPGRPRRVAVRRPPAATQSRRGVS